MKKLTFVGLFTLMLLLGGCTKKIDKVITFDTYTMEWKTKYEYQESPTVFGSAMKEYLQKQEGSGFKGSLIVAKMPMQTGIDVKRYIEINGKSMVRKIPGAKVVGTDIFSFNCDSGAVDGALQKIKVTTEGTDRYINQFYFMGTDSLYAISTMSEDKKESNNLAKSIKTIQCSSVK